MICLGNMCVDTLHKGENDDDNNNNNNNNSNNTETLLSFSFKHEPHFLFEIFLTAVPLKIQVSGMPSYVDW
jgi:hypothetical protein